MLLSHALPTCDARVSPRVLHTLPVKKTKSYSVQLYIWHPQEASRPGAFSSRRQRDQSSRHYSSGCQKRLKGIAMDSPPPYPATSTQKVQQHPQPQPQEQPPPYSSLNLDSPLQRPRGQRPPPPYPFPRSERPPSPPRLDDWDSLECEGDSSYLGRFPGVAFCPKCE